MKPDQKPAEKPQDDIKIKELDYIRHVPVELILDYEVRASWWAPYCERPYLAWIASWWFSRKIKAKYPRYLNHMLKQVDEQKKLFDILKAQKDRVEGKTVQEGEAE